MKDRMAVVYPRAAGLDVHKMQITASVRICESHTHQPALDTRVFSALPQGLSALVEWLGASTKSKQRPWRGRECTGWPRSRR